MIFLTCLFGYVSFFFLFNYYLQVIIITNDSKRNIEIVCNKVIISNFFNNFFYVRNMYRFLNTRKRNVISIDLLYV